MKNRSIQYRPVSHVSRVVTATIILVFGAHCEASPTNNNDGYTTGSDNTLTGSTRSAVIGWGNSASDFPDYLTWGYLSGGGNIILGGDNHALYTGNSFVGGQSNATSYQDGVMLFGYGNTAYAYQDHPGQANVLLGYSNSIDVSQGPVSVWGSLLFGAYNTTTEPDSWVFGRDNIGQSETVTLGCHAAPVSSAALIVGTGGPGGRANGMVIYKNGLVNIPGNVSLSSGSGIFFGSNTTATLRAASNGSAIFPLAVTLENGLQLAGGTFNIASTAAASSSATGAFTVAGGIGVGMDSWFNGVRIGRGAGGISSNTSVGNTALHLNTSGTCNSAIGYFALSNNTTGYANSAMGFAALSNITSGGSNTAMGYRAICSGTTAGYNTAVGSRAGEFVTTGEHNTYMGAEAGLYVANQDMTTLTSSSYSVFIGKGSRGVNGNTNSIVIGANALGEGSNTTVIGNSSTANTKLYGQVQNLGGTRTPWVSAVSYESETGNFQAIGAWETTSDGNSIAMGWGTAVSGFDTPSIHSAISIGGYTRDPLTGYECYGPSSGVPANFAGASCATAFGGRVNEALGLCSYAMGNQITARSAFSTALGSRNLSATDTTADTGTWVENSVLFELGNGNPAGQPWFASEYSNAITTLKNGQTTLTNKAWKNRAANVTPTADPDSNTTNDSGGNALVVEGHTVLKGKVVIESPQGDIGMGIYGQ